MTLDTYIENLKAIVSNNPQAKKYVVVASSDDEGNSFSPVIFTPTIGEYDGDDFNTTTNNPNAVCVN